MQEAAFTDCATGVMVNSGFLDGMSVADAKKAITEYLTEKHIGEAKVNFKLRDWVFSASVTGASRSPSSTARSAAPSRSMRRTCRWSCRMSRATSRRTTVSPACRHHGLGQHDLPCCGGPAKRETDTMPQWAGSSWYYLRYMDPHNDEALASPEALRYWSPVDWYNGGMEHTTLHLLYSRFWHKFLYDIGVVPTKEPYAKRTSHGMILGEGGIKMSKSRGNVINPTDVIAEYGADTMRTYIIFIGDFEKAASWSTNAVKGCKRFLDKVWNLAETVTDHETAYSAKNESILHKTIRKVTSDIDALKGQHRAGRAHDADVYADGQRLQRCRAQNAPAAARPVCAALCDEIWQQHGFEGICSVSAWPAYDESKCRDAEIDMAVQVNGKLRGTIHVAADLDDETVVQTALADEKDRPLPREDRRRAAQEHRCQKQAGQPHRKVMESGRSA